MNIPPNSLENQFLQRGATVNSIKQTESILGKHFPDDYVEFLKATNGYEGLIGNNSYVRLWGVEEIPELNIAYEVNEYAPGILLIGSDGGGGGLWL